MKWDWGKGIALSFVLFCGFVITIVVLAFQENIDLVSDTYYQDELVYQDRINQRINLSASGQKISLQQNEQHLILSFPEVFEAARGEVQFYHPSRAIFDKSFQIAINATNQQLIDKTQMIKGKFKVQMSWESDGKNYYQEQEVFLQ